MKTTRCRDCGGLLGSGKSVNLCPQSQKKNRRLPGEEPEPTKGGFTLAAVVTSPAGGYGVGEYAPVTLNADGTYTIDTEGEPAAAVTPFI